MTRIRSAAQRAPQTLEAATALLVRYAAASTEIGAIQANRNAALTRINGAADAAIVPLVAELKDIAAQLKPWWAASIDALTGGKRKSIDLGGCTIGYRMSPPKVVYAHGKDEEAVAALRATDLAAELIRTAHSLDKPAILRMLEGDDAAKLAELGFDTKQTEAFFIDLAVPAELAVEMAGDAPATPA